MKWVAWCPIKGFHVAEGVRSVHDSAISIGGVAVWTCYPRMLLDVRDKCDLWGVVRGLAEKLEGAHD